MSSISNEFTIAAPSLTAASNPSPHISVQISLVVDDPPVQVHPVSAAPTRFSVRTSWIFQQPTWKTVKGFPGWPIGIPGDVRGVLGDVIWKEIWGDGKRYNSNSSYWDDGNTANGDGCQGRCSYSKEYWVQRDSYLD